jgi:tRNA-binding protein
MDRIEFSDFEKVDIRVGEIVEVEDFERARQPSYKVSVAFGGDIGTKRSSVQARNYEKDEILGAQVVCVVNLGPKNIAGFRSEVLVLGVPGADGQLSLLKPSREAKLGSRMY